MYIHGIGHYHPENIIDNAFIEELGIGTTDQWIVTRTGIETRHTVLPLGYIKATGNRNPRCADEVSLLDNAQTGYEAALMALRRANLRTSDIGMVVAGGCSPRMGSPAESCLIAAQLGIAVPCLDINSACSTFAVQIRMLSQMCDLPDFVLVVNPENMTRTVDYTDRATAVLMGDCTAAAVVSSKHPGRCRVAASTMQTDVFGWRKVTIPARGHLHQEGHAVQNFAIRSMVSIVERMRPAARFQFIGHQANLPMLRSVCQRAGIDESAHLHNVERFGNCGAAGMPSVLSECWDSFRAGDTVLAAVVGAGLTSAGLLLEFEEANRQ